MRGGRLLRRLPLPLTPTLSPLKSGEREKCASTAALGVVRAVPWARSLVWRRFAYFFVPKSTLGVCCSCTGMSKVASGCEDEYMTERQMRPGKVVSSVL